MRLIGLVTALLLAACGAKPAALRLLPQPASVQPHSGSFELQQDAAIGVPPGDPGSRTAAEWLASLVQRTHGRTLPIVERPSMVTFARVADERPEGYRLRVTRAGANASARGDAGLLHAATTFWQMLDADGRAPAATIADAPRFRWRGLMLDSARHFQTVGFIKALIDAMAANKLNVLHWHLVDDQGWRIEIKKYPRLTEVGAFRRPATAPGAPPLPMVGGFYTQAEIREVVAHATSRGVMIVPEIEMPGHALSAIRAYPRLGTGTPVPPGVESHWGVLPWLYNVEEETFGFLEDVLAEVMALFPGAYIHVGGDEAVKDQWRASPRVQARMKALGIADESKLQSWFMARIGRFLQANGRKLIGWDEILDGGAPSGATIMSWRGIDGAVAAARAGHDAVLSPAPTLYLDHLQSGAPGEGPGRGNPQTLEMVYAFDPMPAALAPDQRRHILGLQGNMWTEHIRGDARAAYMAFPRASAIAEIGWSERRGDYSEFVRRLSSQSERLAKLGVVGRTVATEAEAAAPNRRTDRELKLCANKVPLALEDDAPATGQRASFLIDILEPCWIFAAAPLEGVREIAIEVGQVPFNFQVGQDRDSVRFRPPATPAGEFEVRLGCAGERIAVLPLAPAASNPAVTRLTAPVASRPGTHDLCLTYTAREVDPLWAIASVELLP